MRSEDKHLLSAFGWLVLLVACLMVGTIGTFDELRKLTESTPDEARGFHTTERQAAFQAADHLLLASAQFAGERGLALAALSAPGPILPAEMAALRERRMRADAALGHTQEQLVFLRSSTVRERILARIGTTHERVASTRNEIDSELARPIDLRTVHTLSKSFEAPTALIDAMADLLRTIHSELKELDRGIAGWLQVQRLASEMAEYAGRERAQIAAFLAAAGGPTRVRLVFANRNHNETVFAWKLAQSTLSTLTPPYHLAEQTKAVEQRYFTDIAEARRAVLSAGQASQARAMTTTEWFQGATLAIDAMVEFGRKAGAVAAQRSSSNS
jgi:hypothetical protein